MSKKVIQEINFVTFSDFWDHINPMGDIGKKLSGYIYRGENSNEYKLLPAVLRKSLEISEQYKVYNEVQALCNFYTEANNYGLKVPNSKILQGNTPEKIIGNHIVWYSDEFEETAALAQHYGIMTRLLDWTKDLFTAFYFASKDELIKFINIPNDEYIVIYALNYEYLMSKINKWRKSDDCYNQKALPIKFVVPHYSDMPNIHAQNGILSYSEIYLDMANSKTWVIDDTPLDEKLQKLADDKKSIHNLSDENILLYKFVLPKPEALNMFNYISRFNYFHSTLFPGYDGIKVTLKQKVLLKNINEGNKHDG
jgi:hypothetical protein